MEWFGFHGEPEDHAVLRQRPRKLCGDQAITSRSISQTCITHVDVRFKLRNTVSTVEKALS
jgi:hypothetical protein